MAVSLPAPPSSELVRGWTDIPLNREGKELANELARDLKGCNIAYLNTSDLERAEDTAEAIEKIAKLPILNSTKALRTWNLGELEGDPLKGAEQTIYRFVAHPNEKPKGGESFGDFQRRVLSWITQDMRLGVKHNIPIGELTHHWVCELVEQWIKDGAKPDLSMDTRLLFRGSEDPPGTVLDLKPEELVAAGGKWTVKRVNPVQVKKFSSGPVLIRHATTSWNAKGRG